jgi:hypothetical protein
MMEKYHQYMRGMLTIIRDQLSLPDSEHYRHFLVHSQGYNLFTKFGHHGCASDFVTGGGPTIGRLNGWPEFTLSDIIPSNPERRPRLGNWMAMDPESAIESMGSDPRHSNAFDSLKPDILRAVLDEIRQRNPLAQVYTTAGELLRAHQAEHGGETPRYRIIFMKKRRGALTDAEGNPLRNAIDIPMAGGQQVLIWYDPTGASLAPEYPGIWLCHNGNFVELGKWDPLALPVCFPLIFGDGQGWFAAGMRPTVNRGGRTVRQPLPDDDSELAVSVVDAGVMSKTRKSLTMTS